MDSRILFVEHISNIGNFNVAVMTVIKIDPELCEFVGAMIGNGNLWTDGSRYRVELTGDPKLDVDYFNYLSFISNNLFGKKPYSLRTHQRGLRWRLQSKDAYRLLQNIGIPTGNGKSHTVTIPALILNEGWFHCKWTIRGIMDTDGTLFFSKKTYTAPIYPTIELRTCSNVLANQLSEVLQQNGFRARLRGDIKEGYHVALYGSEMLKLWIDKIGFSNPKHYNKLTF